MRSDDYKKVMGRAQISEKCREKLLDAAENAPNGIVVDEPVEIIRHTPWYRRTGFAAAASLVLVAGLVGTVGVNMMSGRDDISAGSDICDSSGVESDGHGAGYCASIPIAPPSISLEEIVRSNGDGMYLMFSDENICRFCVDDNWFFYDFEKKEIVFSADMKKTFEDVGITGTGFGDVEWSGITSLTTEDEFYPAVHFKEYDAPMLFKLDVENNVLMFMDEAESAELSDHVQREVWVPQPDWENNLTRCYHIGDNDFVNIFIENMYFDVKEETKRALVLERCLKDHAEPERFTLCSVELPLVRDPEITPVDDDGLSLPIDGDIISNFVVSPRFIAFTDMTCDPEYETDYRIYGEWFSVEKLVDGQWQKFYRFGNKDYVLPEIGYARDSEKGGLRLTFDYAKVYGELEPGHYHIETYSDEDKEFITLSFDFEIAGDAE